MAFFVGRRENMKKIILLMVLGLIMVGCGESSPKENKVVIGIIQLAQHPSLDAAVEGMKVELDKLASVNGMSVEYKFQNAQGDMTKLDSIIQGYISEEVDLIYAVATAAAQTAMNLTKDTDIPVVFNAVTDPVSAGIVKSMESSGNNVTGVSDISPVEKQIAIVKEILPNTKKVGVLYNIGEVNSKVQIETLTAVANQQDLEIVPVGVADQADLSLAAQQICEKVDVIYNITDNMVVAATPMIVDIATKNNIPVFASEDGQLDQGILAAESLSYYDLGVEAGIMCSEILFKEIDPSELPIKTSESTKLFINESMVEKLGVEIPKSVQDRKE